MFDRLISWLNRALFIAALLLLALALWERILRSFGWSISWLPYEPSRLLEISASLLIFVVAMLLRQIRDQQRSARP